MADDHDPRAPEPVRRPDDDQEARHPDARVTSPLRTGPPSVPTRVHTQARRAATATPTVVPLARRRGARMGPRSTGDGSSSAAPGSPPVPRTPAPAGPGDDARDEANGTRPASPPRPGAGPRPADVSRAGGTPPTTKLPAAAAPPTAPVATGVDARPAATVSGAAPGEHRVDETPTTANPVAPTSTDHLPTEQVPTRTTGSDSPGPETSISAGLPTERMPASPGAGIPDRSGPGRGPSPQGGSGRGRGPGRPAASSPAGPPRPASRPRPDEASVAAPEKPASPTGTASEEPAVGATSSGGTPASKATNSVRTHDPDWAATSTVLAGFGTRLATLRRTWTWLRTGKLIAATTAFMIMATTGLAWAGLAGLVREIGALDPDSSAIRDAAAQRGDQNFLIVGSDTRVGAIPDEDAGNAADVPGARADTVMVVHVPEDRSRVTVVSFPRDLEISRPPCEHWDPVSGQYSSQTVPRTPQVKLNSAYAAGGPRCVTKVVQELSGLAINHFLGVDFQGFKGMVDAVHGVPMCVEKPVRDGILGTVVPRAGTSVLSGDQALNFVRARHVVGDPSSDYGRIQRQQRFLSSLLRTTLSAGTLLDPGKLRGFVEAVSRSTFGENVGANQLLGLGQSLGDLNPATVTFTTIPTTGTANSRGNEVPRESADRDLFGSIIDNRPMPGQAPPPPAPGAAPGAPAPPPSSPQQVTTRLVDARGPSGTSGSSGSSDDSSSDDSSSGDSSGGARQSSSAVASILRSEGFNVVPTTAPVVSGERTTLRFSPDQAPAAVLLGHSVPGAALDPSAPTPGTLTLILGDDFDGNVGREAAQHTAPVVPTITAADARCS